MKTFPRRKKHDKSYLQIQQPVVVTSYEICMNDFVHLADKTWKLLIVDEGHRIKNLNCKLIRYFLKVNHPDMENKNNNNLFTSLFVITCLLFITNALIH